MYCSYGPTYYMIPSFKLLAISHLCFAVDAYLNIEACQLETSWYNREKFADVIITGTVLSLSPSRERLESAKYLLDRGQVAVKRVIKGEPKLVSPTTVILVENFGDPGVCHSNVAKRDTKIFLLKRNLSTGNYRLNSSIIRLTLKNLDRVSAFARGNAIISSRSPIPETPCEKVFCGLNFTCHASQPSGNAVCIEKEDPCTTHNPCKYGARCVGNYLTGHRQCICPAKCADFVDIGSHLSNSKFVCGNDSVTYENRCELQRASCKEQRPIHVEFPGVCGGCARKQCDFYASCEVDGLGVPRCVCPSACTSENKPVCGVDGVTYQNECHMRSTACEQQRFVVVAAPLPCESIPSNLPAGLLNYEEEETEGLEDDGLGQSALDLSQTSCDQTLCQEFGGVCSTIDNHQQCLCKFDCSSSKEAVKCGELISDGTKRLYANECSLRKHACQKLGKIVVVSSDQCGDLGTFPCIGALPLRNNITGLDLHCGEEAHSAKCPPGSFCHKPISATYAKCCPQESVPFEGCTTSRYGCCPDGVTHAQGYGSYGCRKALLNIHEPCECNKIGSLSAKCDEETKKCKCRDNVGGSRCDRCQPGFWGLQKSASTPMGCDACACSKFGAVRQDCEQMSGRCVCIGGVIGMTCEKCADDRLVLQMGGCVSAEKHSPHPSSCGELICHFGAACVQRNGQAQCVCTTTKSCHEEEERVVCGSDGKENSTYSSVCQLRLRACNFQKDITIVRWGICPEEDGRSYRTVEPFVVSGLQSDMNFDPFDGNSLNSSPLGHSTSVEKRQREDSNPRFELLGKNECDKKPCANGGTCTETEFSYECQCLPGFRGLHCTEERLTNIPSFNGQSYFELRPMRSQSIDSIEIDFVTYSLDGILMYNGQKPDGSGDFISLALRGGFVEFRYDLGDGPALVKTTVPVTLEKRHYLVARRFNQDALLKLDTHVEVSGRSPGNRNLLDIEDNLFVGAVPTDKAVHDKIGCELGFVGCIFSIKILKKYLGLSDPDANDIVAAFEIGECSKKACMGSPCLNRADYVHASPRAVPNADDQRSRCKSSNGTYSPHCARERTTVRSPPLANFSGESYLTLPPITDGNPVLTIEIWLLTRSPNGLILYAGQRPGSSGGDFICLKLSYSRYELVFDLGDGPVNITYPEQVQLSTWHSVKLLRHGKRASLQVNDFPLVSGESQGFLTELNVGTLTFIGGVHYPSLLSKLANVDTFFKGAIQMIQINNRKWTNILQDALESHKIDEYMGAPCHDSTQPCHNGGLCIPRLETFFCKCPAGYDTRHDCSAEATLPQESKPNREAVQFDGHTFLQYPNMVSYSVTSQDHNMFKLRLRTTALDGLILWQQSTARPISKAHFALALVHGHPEVTFNMGKETEVLSIRSNKFISDGKWHSVSIERIKHTGSLNVDGEKHTKVLTQGPIALRTDGKLYVGGFSDVPNGFTASYYQGFRGCLTDVFVSHDQPLLLSANRTFGLKACAIDKTEKEFE